MSTGQETNGTNGAPKMAQVTQAKKETEAEELARLRSEVSEMKAAENAGIRTQRVESGQRKGHIRLYGVSDGPITLSSEEWKLLAKHIRRVTLLLSSEE